MLKLFSNKKNKLKDENEEKDTKKRYSLDSLFIINVGYSTHIENGMSEKFHFVNYTIAKCNYDPSNPEYVDVFTNQKYLLFGDYHCKTGSQCCYKPIPVMACLKTCDYKNNILKNGYLTQDELLAIYNLINTDIMKPDYSETNYNINNINNKEEKTNNTENTISEKIMNNKIYDNEPAICRDQEIREIITILASYNKCPILVGTSGTGKTSIVEELVYKIKNNQVPNFLKNRIIIELDTSSLIAGTRYVGTLEEKFIKLIKSVKNKKAILFIDEIHTIYGAGSSSKNDNDLAEMFKHAIDRDNICIIGTTTDEEYKKYFANDALKRRFEKVVITEPSNEKLKIILNHTLNNFSTNMNVSIDNINTYEIIDIIINATKKESRTYDDNTNNPDLAISIIDKAFANARINDNEELTIEDFIYAIESCSRIYSGSRENAIQQLKNLKVKVKKLENNIISFY